MPSERISPRAVLARLTRSGIWSTWTSSWARRGAHVVLDADSIAAHLYHHACTRKPSGGCNSGSSNLVNYKEFARLIAQVIDHLRDGLQLTPVLVYGGVHKWPGLHAAHLLMLAGNNHDKTVLGSSELAKLPNLALQIFKLVASGRSVKAHQAAYGAYPTLVKLARDLRCPVLTNEGDFILMDVRAGFVLFEDYFQLHLNNGPGGLTRSPSSASCASTSSAASSTAGGRPSRSKLSSGSGPKSASALSSRRDPPRRPTSASSTGSTRSSKGAPPPPPPPPPQQVKVRLHMHRLFLRQHPGLDHALALKMMPFTCCEFLTQYAKSVASIRVMSRDLLPEDATPKDNKKTPGSRELYHLAAARLESVMRFLCARTGDILPFLIHGEVARLNSSRFEDDYAALHDHYAIAYDLRGHLRALMEARGQKLDAPQLNHLQRALTERECTADFWLHLVCGPSAASTHDFGRSLHSEDTKTLHSARAVLDRPRSWALSVLAGVAQGAGRGSPSIRTLDRQGQKVVERTLSVGTALKKQHEPQGRGAVTLAQVARKSLSKQEAAAFINSAFNSRDLTKLESTKLEQLLAEWVPLEAKNLHKSKTGGAAKTSPQSPASSSPVSPSRSSEAPGQHGHQLAVLLGLHKFSLEQAAEGDQHFKTHYLRLGQHFEIGLVNHHAYTSYLQLAEAANRATKGTAAASNQEFHRDALEHSLRHLIELINKRDLENVICLGFSETHEAPSHKQQQRPARSVSPGKAPKSASSQRSMSPASVESSTGGGAGAFGQSGELRKQIKHMIELFNATLEAYCELNAFLNYPLPRLHLHTSYNSILLYNLILFSCQEPINTRLVKF